MLSRAVKEHVRCGGLLPRASSPPMTAEAVAGTLMQYHDQMVLTGSMAVQEATVLSRSVNEHERCGGLPLRASLKDFLASITAEAVAGTLMQHHETDGADRVYGCAGGDSAVQVCERARAQEGREGGLLKSTWGLPGLQVLQRCALPDSDLKSH